MLEARERKRSRGYERRSFNKVYYEDMWNSYDECKNIVKMEWLKWHTNTKTNPAQKFKTIAKSSLGQLQL